MQPFNKEKINKVISGTSDKQSAKEVAEWFASSMEGRQYLSDMLDKDAYLLEHEISEEPTMSMKQSDILYSKIRKSIYRQRFKIGLLKVAAVFLPFVVLIGLGFYLNKQVGLFGKTQYSELYIPKGEKARIFFQDGTEVYLNADTKIRYPEKFGLQKRNVYLEGEAYFNVASNKRRPFVVHTGKSRVTVLGTSFNVNSYATDKKIKVVLDEGKVLFSSAGNTYSLQPGQKFIFDKITGEAKVANLKKSMDESMWRENYIRLQDTPLLETLNLLDRRFNVRFRVPDAEAARYSFTLTTKDKPLDFVLDELTKIAPLKFSGESDTVVVKTN